MMLRNSELSPEISRLKIFLTLPPRPRAFSGGTPLLIHSTLFFRFSRNLGFTRENENSLIKSIVAAP